MSSFLQEISLFHCNLVMCNFYVYVFLDPRKPGLFSYDEFQFKNEPFYIGKGSKNRDSEHFKPSEMKRDYNPYKNRKIRKIQKIGIQPVILRIKESLTESQAFDLEIKAIQAIGRKKDGGPLTNLYQQGASRYCKQPRQHRENASNQVDNLSPQKYSLVETDQSR